MIYPQTFEQKIGFLDVRNALKERCLSPLGKDVANEMTFMTDADTIQTRLSQTFEFRELTRTGAEIPMQHVFDMRQALLRVRLEGTHLEEDELFDLLRSLTTIGALVAFFRKSDAEDAESWESPMLAALADGVPVFPLIVSRIEQTLDKYGRIKDTATQELARIRMELRRAEGSVSRTLASILRSAQSEGLVDKDVAPTMRDGRLVIPIAPGMKRRLPGIVHDESATGKTVFVEPTQVVEANNHIRELEAEERREVIRILTELSKQIRPCVSDMLVSYRFLGEVDFLRARATLADQWKCVEPKVVSRPHIDWTRAFHPLLSQKKEMVPLDIQLTSQDRMLVISGPNAGGKSVTLKTVGLLQYMVQCGLSIPVSERSTVGLFEHLMMDIGDEQSLEDDLSTYSSHLLNMKQMMRQGNAATLILIDEFGTGTEPQIGAAIAESILAQFVAKGMWGVITTHYQNLKHFADSHDGVVNGAMLYDRHEMRPLFQLAIGRPGSSFAIEIARKIGLPEAVIKAAADIVGSDYIQSDKYLQDIVRDKRYWESKRQTIHQREKDMERTIARYEERLAELESQRKDIMAHARQQASELFAEANKRIEHTIREIREHQAEKEETRLIREELKTFEQNLQQGKTKKEQGLMDEDSFQKKLDEVKKRKERKEKRKEQKEKQKTAAAQAQAKNTHREQHFEQGCSVRIIGLQSIGTIESTDGKQAVVIFGNMKTKMDLKRLELVSDEKARQVQQSSSAGSRMTRTTIDEHRADFHHELDVRGLRADEALNQVQYFLDDAILVGVSQVRILHGKGNGILRQLIRQYLGTVPNVSNYRDEHVQFGGAGITVVEIG